MVDSNGKYVVGMTVFGRPFQAMRLLTLALTLGSVQNAWAVDLIGYVPHYRMNSSYVNDVLPDQLALLDEVRYFGISVNASAGLTTTAADLSNIQTIESVINALPETQRPRLGITIGGAGQSAGFSTVAASSTLRDRFAQNLEALLDQTGAVAVDLDWEHPAAGAERNSLFPAMLTRIKQEFGDSRRVYATVAPSVIVSNSIFAGPHAIDGVSLMTYDLGWWSNDPSNPNTGQHSLQADVATAVRAWTDAPGSTNQRPWVFGSWGNDVPTDKLGIGLPMYGRGFNGSSAGLAVTYRDLIAGGTTNNGSSYQYQGSDVWIPSRDMVKQRVDFAVAQDLQNIIIWELAQDLPPDHQNSMLRAAQRPDGDFNGDGAWDSSDIDTLSTAIAASSNDAAFDMNGDGLITLADISGDQVGWLAIGGARNPQSTGGNPFLSGDANLDGSVDVSDFNLWNNNKFTSAGSWSRGDFNADGVVDVSDFNVWNTTKFNRSRSAAAVPEPSVCWQLFALGLAPMWLARCSQAGYSKKS